MLQAECKVVSFNLGRSVVQAVKT